MSFYGDVRALLNKTSSKYRRRGFLFYSKLPWIHPFSPQFYIAYVLLWKQPQETRKRCESYVHTWSTYHAFLGLVRSP